MNTIKDLIKNELSKMSTNDLMGVVNEGVGELEAWMQDLSVQQGIDAETIELMAEIRRADAEELMGDVQRELARRSK